MLPRQSFLYYHEQYSLPAPEVLCCSSPGAAAAHFPLPTGVNTLLRRLMVFRRFFPRFFRREAFQIMSR